MFGSYLDVFFDMLMLFDVYLTFVGALWMFVDVWLLPVFLVC